jgi:hypothetical protein
MRFVSTDLVSSSLISFSHAHCMLLSCPRARRGRPLLARARRLLHLTGPRPRRRHLTGPHRNRPWPPMPDLPGRQELYQEQGVDPRWPDRIRRPRVVEGLGAAPEAVLDAGEGAASAAARGGSCADASEVRPWAGEIRQGTAAGAPAATQRDHNRCTSHCLSHL